MHKLAILLQRVALGDRVSFECLYQLSSGRLFSITKSILRHDGDAEDALQEVYIKIWKRAHQFRATQGSPESWLASIARNHAIDMMRARKPNANSIDEVSELACDDASPEENASNSSDGARVNLCMSKLQTGKAEAVKRAYVEGLSYQELADAYGVPINTMRTWLRRSLLELRQCLNCDHPVPLKTTVEDHSLKFGKGEASQNASFRITFDT